MKDAEGRNLTIDGNVTMASLNNLNYNLNIQSDRFLAYQGPPDNLPGQDNRVLITSDIDVSATEIFQQ
ncbi:MAG: hypothetical protein HC905_13190 [Bacteroidales bacterium]|nr:hypothetical protein [Bacteroidales bacterium]